jgi:hypothetical protein
VRFGPRSRGTGSPGFGGVPEEVVMDNPRALVVRHDAVTRSVQFNDKLGGG